VLKPGDQHLTEDELDHLAGISPLDRHAGVQMDSSDQSSVGHLNECENCRSRIDQRIAAARSLALLKAPVSQIRGGDCPSDEEWMNAAAGLAEEDVSRKMLDHATSCDHCGPLFRELVQQFSDSASSEETEMVASLSSNSAEWQHKLASRLSVSSGVPKTKAQAPIGFWFLKWRALGFTAAATAAVLTWVLFPRPQQRVEKLIAQAYTERRNLEPRIPGAEFGPVRVERTTQTSHMDSPSSLLEAEKEIAGNLAKNPSDPFWLQSRARAELLEGNYEGAIGALREALAAKPDSSTLLIDLATAYSQRADASGSSEDVGRAIDLLGKALQVSPRDPVALFNRALISRKALLFSQAIEDWQNYLEVEPTGKWADEARSRMEEARQEQEKRKHSSTTPLLTPSQFAELRLDDSTSVDAIDERIESYNTVALSKWLSLAYPLSPSDASETLAARRALTTLAKISLDRHSDRWWSDLLRETSSPLLARALDHLSAAIRANESGDTAAAHNHAALTIRLFRSAGPNEAGILRARVEDLYAFNIDQDADKCIRAIDPLHDSTQIEAYRWLEIEFQIQRGNCLWLQEDLGKARIAYSTAATEATTAQYQAILLGAQDHWSMAAGAGGDYVGGWRIAIQGLKQFWDGDFDDVRGYNFYYSLCEMARFRREPFLELSIWKEAIPLTESSHDLAQVAVAHSLFANAALATHDSPQALREFEQASQLFARSPQIESTRLARLEAQTRLAGVEISLGRNQSALSHLRAIEPELGQLSDNYLKVLFYDNFGKALVSNGELTDGETALHSALRLAELQLQSVSDRNSRIDWKVHASDTYRDLVSLTFRKGDVEEALELWESFKAAPLRVRSKTEPSLPDSTSIGQPDALVAPRLKDLTKATIVTYALLPHELVIWLYDDRGVKSHRVEISTVELTTAAARFRELCSNPKSNIELVRRQARNLYQRLIAPIEPYFQSGRTLIIELDEGLNGLPMEALLDSQSHYLGERGPLLSSLGIFYETQTQGELRITTDTPALVVAVSAPRSDLGPSVLSLPDVVSEGELVARRFRAASLLTDRNATLHETLQRIPTTGVFHFAGHASKSYSMPGLLLSDTALTARSLEKLKVSRTQLVVLSACDTEAGALGSVEAADSLVGYFVRAGVPRVVASRWNVDSALTRQFMNAFYAQLLAGSSVEESLFQAQRAMRSQLVFVHPFYWAAFTVFGSAIS